MSICFLGATLLFSCGHPAPKAMPKDSIKLDSVKHVVTKFQKRTDTLAIPEDTIPKVVIPEGTIQVAEDKVDTTSKMKMLDNNCSYTQQDDVSPKDAKRSWKGIFHDKSNCYIKSTKIKFIRERSELDDEGQMTGWRLKCIDKDTCYQLISGDDYIIEGPVKILKIEDFYYAGQKKEFNYGGIVYTLYTTGAKRNGKVYNFKIFLMATIKGHTFNQQIRSLGNDIALHNGGDNVDSIFIEFVGDIDGDKIPDFIIGDGGNFFGSSSLYLSKPAGDKAILKLVAYFSQSD
jgi:hypothetical protein